MSKLKNAGKHKDGSAKAAPVAAEWKPHLDAYPDKQRLVFANEGDLDRAIDLLWSDGLRTLPHDTPDGRSLIIPAEAVEYFVRSGLEFTAKRLRSINDLSPEEIGKLRR